MLKIGEFARLSQVSVKTLRHYDALGVLRPALVDPESGYRLYDIGQLVEVVRILTLVGLRETVATTAEIGPFAQKVVRSCAQHAVVSAGPLIHLYYDDSLPEEGFDLFAGMPVTALPTDMSELS